jgi:hypothetical protein
VRPTWRPEPPSSRGSVGQPNPTLSGRRGLAAVAKRALGSAAAATAPTPSANKTAAADVPPPPRPIGVAALAHVQAASVERTVSRRHHRVSRARDHLTLLRYHQPAVVDTAAPSSPASRGGRRAAIGFDFQARVGAWLAAQMLVGSGSSSLPGLPEHSIIERLAFETGDAVDDIRIESRSSSGRVRSWMQAKRNITVTAKHNGDLAKVIAQCLAAFGQHDAESVFYIVCSADSRRVIQNLERARTTFDNTSLTREARRAKTVLRTLGAHDALLAKLRFLALDVEDDGSDCQRAQDLLAMHILPTSESRRAAWSALVAECLRLIARGMSACGDDMRIALARAGLAAAPSISTQFHERVSHALSRIQELLASPPPFIPPTDHTPTFVKDLASRVANGEDLELLASSGTGKSLVLRHLAVTLGEDDYVPLLLSVASVATVPSLWITDCAQLVGLTPDDARRLAQDQQLVVLIDGTNDLPPTLREAMRRELLSWKDRGARLVVCGHGSIEIGASPIMSLDVYDINARRRLLGLGSAPPTRIEQSILDAFRRPFDLTIARACMADVPEGASLYEIYDAFVTSRLVQSGIPRGEHAAVDEIALHLLREVRTSLGLDEALRHCRGHASLGRLAAAGVLELTRARVLFSHETLRNFCAARRLLSISTTAADLAGHCNTPALSILAPFVFQGIKCENARRVAAETCESLRNVAFPAAKGHFGAQLASWMRVECRTVARVAIDALQTLNVTRVTTDSNESVGSNHVIVSTQAPPSAWQLTCLYTLGLMAGIDTYWPIVSDLISTTEIALIAQLDAQRIGRRYGLSLIWGPRGRMSRLGATEAMAGASQGYNVSVGRAFTSVLTEQQLCLGVRHLVLLQLRRAILDGALDAAEPWIHNIPAFLIETWHIGIRDSKFEISEIVCALAHNGNVDVNGLRDWIRTLDPNKDILLNGVILEMADAFGLIAGYEDPQDMTLRARAILAQKDDPLARSMALGIVSGRFEDIIGAVHNEVFEALEEDERASLLAMALLEADAPLTTEVLLQELVLIPTAGNCELAPAAFARWFAPPEPTGFMFSSSVEAFCIAACGLASLGAPMPQTGDTESRRAWQAIMRALFLAPDSEESRAIWRSAAENGIHWMPVLEWIIAGLSHLHGGMHQRAPDPLCHRTALVTLLETWLPIVHNWEPYCPHNGCGITALILARVLGDGALEILVRRLVEDPLLGHHAVDALRHWGKPIGFPYPYEHRVRSQGGAFED